MLYYNTATTDNAVQKQCLNVYKLIRLKRKA